MVIAAEAAGLAGFHHDHLLVPVDQADRAVVYLLSLRGLEPRPHR